MIPLKIFCRPSVTYLKIFLWATDVESRHCSQRLAVLTVFIINHKYCSKQSSLTAIDRIKSGKNAKVLQWAKDVGDLCSLETQRQRRSKASQGTPGFTVGWDNVGTVNISIGSALRCLNSKSVPWALSSEHCLGTGSSTHGQGDQDVPLPQDGPGNCCQEPFPYCSSPVSVLCSQLSM